MTKETPGVMEAFAIWKDIVESEIDNAFINFPKIELPSEELPKLQEAIKKRIHELQRAHSSHHIKELPKFWSALFSGAEFKEEKAGRRFRYYLVETFMSSGRCYLYKTRLHASSRRAALRKFEKLSTRSVGQLKVKFDYAGQEPVGYVRMDFKVDWSKSNE